MDNVLHLIGIAKKAGKLQVGEEPVGAAARAHQAKLLLIASDAAENSVRRASHFGESGNVLWLVTPYTKADFGTVTGRASCAMMAVTDAGFASSIAAKLAEADQTKYGAAAEQLKTKAERVLQRQKEQRTHEKNLKSGKTKPWAPPPQGAPVGDTGKDSSSGKPQGKRDTWNGGKPAGKKLAPGGRPAGKKFAPGEKPAWGGKPSAPGGKPAWGGKPSAPGVRPDGKPYSASGRPYAGRKPYDKNAASGPKAATGEISENANPEHKPLRTGDHIKTGSAKPSGENRKPGNNKPWTKSSRPGFAFHGPKRTTSKSSYPSKAPKGN